MAFDAETLPSGFYGNLVLNRTYDTLGRSEGYNLGGTLSPVSATYGYEATGRLSTVSDGSDTFTYAYENNSNLLASLTGPQHTTAYTYEPNRNVMTILDNQVSGSSLAKYAYSYDALGRRDDRSQSGSAISTSTDDFSYNSRSEVIASSNSAETDAKWNPTYSFDKIGNRKSSTGWKPVASYSTNSINQYTLLGSASPIHDLDGNLTSDGGTWTYTWNNENRLTVATNGSARLRFTYDYQGRLVQQLKETENQTTGNWETDDSVVFVYDGWNRIAKYIDSTLDSTYLFGLDLSGSMQGAGGVGGLLKEGDLYPTFDANGNIMQKLDGTGATVMNVVYDPCGNIISGTLVGEYGFSTKPLIDDLDWYYYGFSYYDPVTGRWPNRDPMGEMGGLNLYGMIDNDSINQWDYLGLKKSVKKCLKKLKKCVGNESKYRAAIDAMEKAGSKWAKADNDCAASWVNYLSDCLDVCPPTKANIESCAHGKAKNGAECKAAKKAWDEYSDAIAEAADEFKDAEKACYSAYKSCLK